MEKQKKSNFNKKYTNKETTLPFRWHKCNGSRLVQVFPKEHLAVFVVKLGHLNPVGV